MENSLTYPCCALGEALLRYLKKARPKGTHREAFLRINRGRSVGDTYTGRAANDAWKCKFVGSSLEANVTNANPRKKREILRR